MRYSYSNLAIAGLLVAATHCSANRNGTSAPPQAGTGFLARRSPFDGAEIETKPPASHRVDAPAPATSTARSAPQQLPPCSLTSPTVRLRLTRGHPMATGTGLELTFGGSSHDNFGAAGFDVLLSLHFRRGEERENHLPSFNDRRTHRVLGHCYRIVDVGRPVVLIDVAPLPPHEPTGKPAAPAPSTQPQPTPAASTTADGGP